MIFHFSKKLKRELQKPPSHKVRAIEVPRVISLRPFRFGAAYYFNTCKKREKTQKI